MMVETMLECSQDFGGVMSNGVLPQWKRELLQRRAARPRPPACAPPPPPPPVCAPPALPEEDEELRYGPGIVKRLQSRYLSLALRDAPRRRPSSLRRAASLEHLLDERPPPAPRAGPPALPRAARPVSIAAPSAELLPRRDFVKRARSVDALSRLAAREEPVAPPPSPPATVIVAPPAPALVPAAAVAAPVVPPPSPPPPPPTARSARPPRRPQPLLRETERPPPDLVRSALRKFEPGSARRAAPAARVSAVLRCLEARSSPAHPAPPPPRTSTPESGRARDPSPASADLSAIDEPEGCTASSLSARPISRAALEGIARAGSSMRFAFSSPQIGSHLPPLAATNPVLVQRMNQPPRRIGVIRPMPPLDREPTPPPSPVPLDKTDLETCPRIMSPVSQEASPVPSPPPSLEIRIEKKDNPPSAVVEPIVRSLVEEKPVEVPLWLRRATETPERVKREDGQLASPEREIPLKPEPLSPKPDLIKVELARKEPLLNGHRKPEATKASPVIENIPNGKSSRISAAKIERAWSSPCEKKQSAVVRDKSDSAVSEVNGVAPWAKKPRAPPAAAAAGNSIVFNFSNRKEVPDYIENDGVILRASKRDKIKAGDPGVVVLHPGALARSDSDSEEEASSGGPPSPCGVRFINDNVLINGRSSILNRPNKDRVAKLKLQFDDSLTRTFEYPSELSLCEPSEDSAPGQHVAALAANTHIASAALSRYTPSKTRPDDFQLGVTRHEAADESTAASQEKAADEEECGDARPCGADVARSWSETRHADLLF